MLVIYLQFIPLGIIFYFVKWAQFLLSVLFDIICIFNRKQKFYYQEVGKINIVYQMDLVQEKLVPMCLLLCYYLGLF